MGKRTRPIRERTRSRPEPVPGVASWHAFFTCGCEGRALMHFIEADDQPADCGKCRQPRQMVAA